MTRSSIGSCCLDCPERHPACHDTCEKYKAAKQVWEAKKQSIKKTRDKYIEYDVFKITNVQRTKKHMKDHRR